MTAPSTNQVLSTTERFEALALPFMRPLYGKALRLTRRPEDAADLVQETYLRAYRTFENFAEGTNCKAWLFTIMYSIFVNSYRKSQRAPDPISIEALEASHQDALADPQWDQAFASLTEAGTGWHRSEVYQALDRLPEEMRTTVHLVDIEEFSYEEAALIQACPVGTIRSRLFRARRVLFEQLKGYAIQFNLQKRPQA